MKPGATTSPRASISRFAGPVSDRPTATTRSPRTATSPKNQGLPLPSTTRPWRMRRSYGASAAAGAADRSMARRGQPSVRMWGSCFEGTAHDTASVPAGRSVDLQAERAYLQDGNLTAEGAEGRRGLFSAPLRALCGEKAWLAQGRTVLRRWGGSLLFI